MQSHDTRAGRVVRVARVIAVAFAFAVVGLGGSRWGSSNGVQLQQTQLAGGSSTTQLERDKMKVAELKAKLAEAEGNRKSSYADVDRTKARPKELTGGNGASLSHRAAVAAGNKAYRALRKGALRDGWLRAARERALAKDAPAAALVRPHNPVRLKTVQISTVLKDIQASLAAQQQATSAALMLLASQGSTGAEGDPEQDHRGRTGRRKDVELENEGNGTVAFNCSDFRAGNHTVCIPRECNSTEFNDSLNTSLPECADPDATTAAASTDTATANETVSNNDTLVLPPPPPPPAPWNEPQDTRGAAVESGAAGVVQGDVWAGAQEKPSYDTIYCYDDNADGGFTRHARSATYCWYHRAYCELYCEGDIMSTPPPVAINSPAAAAYGWRSGYVSWESWAKRLKMLSPFATYGTAVDRLPKFNVGGINKIHPVKIPETTGGTNGGIFEKYYQDGR